MIQFSSNFTAIACAFVGYVVTFYSFKIFSVHRGCRIQTEEFRETLTVHISNHGPITKRSNICRNRSGATRNHGNKSPFPNNDPQNEVTERYSENIMERTLLPNLAILFIRFDHMFFLRVKKFEYNYGVK